MPTLGESFALAALAASSLNRFANRVHIVAMGWTVETVAAVDAEIEGLPAALRTRLVRLLEGGRVSPSFATLRRYAAATGTRLTVGLVSLSSLR